MMTSRIANACPHCRSRMRTITSRQQSPLVRDVYLDCMNVDCGFRCVAQVGIVRALVQSLIPNAQVSLPIVERRANDIVAPSTTLPAAHETATTPPNGAAGSPYAPMMLN